MAATIGQKHKNGFKIVEIWDNHSESLKNNLYNDFKGPEHLLVGMNLENKIDTCQTTVLRLILSSCARNTYITIRIEYVYIRRVWMTISKRVPAVPKQMTEMWKRKPHVAFLDIQGFMPYYYVNGCETNFK